MTRKSLAHCPGGEVCSLISEFDDLKTEVERLSTMVSTDPMTNLHNYRHFCHVLEQEADRSLRTLLPTTLIMLDVDHFKKVNDTWGHEVGNLALKLIAQCLMHNVRKLDIACRYGGEEFAIILPSTDIVTGAQVAERIRHSIETSPLRITLANGTQETIHLTTSLGLSMYPGSMVQHINQIVEAADEQLYKAKQQGRNQVCYVAPKFQDAQQVSSDEKEALFNMFDSPEEK